ncbi:Terminase RNaseH-like domain containing protein [uncultured Caudovirales phage]|uniref:Terminase RNaseH-like domain containing protein n=1 Tax=uncultured Caudovirales phage TaxID=2100421 RepID=A0A6J5MLG2_9CAUD|nr:Terminase RNaseH-like domain containing protein [uncultured Caudovirales phage]
MNLWLPGNNKKTGELYLPLERRKLIQNNFEFFIRYIYRTLFKKPLKGFGENEFGRMLMNAFMKFYHTTAKFHFINIPPRFGKTEMTVLYEAWCLGRRMKSKFMYITYSEILASEPSKKLKIIIKSPQYRSIFPELEIAKNCDGTTYFQTTAGGQHYATGADGTTTGFGFGDGGGMFIDDLIKSKEVHSHVIRSDRNEMIRSTLLSRANQAEAPMMFIAQRLHEDDVFGSFIPTLSVPYEHLILKSIVKNNSLCKSTIALEQLENLRDNSPNIFYAQYEQQPIKGEDLLFDIKGITRLETAPDNDLITHSFIVCDTSMIDSPTSDFTVFGHFYVAAVENYKEHYRFDSKEKRGYFENKNQIIKLVLREVFVSRLDAGNLLSNFEKFLDERLENSEVKPNKIFIEAQVSGIALYQQMIQLCERGQKYRDENFTVQPIGRGTGEKKKKRFIDVSGFVEHGRLQICDNRYHVNKFSETEYILNHMKNITRTDKEQKDDIADVITYALAHTFIGIYNSQVKKMLGNFSTEALAILINNLNKQIIT